jgi:hypothetical protein
MSVLRVELRYDDAPFGGDIDKSSRALFASLMSLADWLDGQNDGSTTRRATIHYPGASETYPPED